MTDPRDRDTDPAPPPSSQLAPLDISPAEELTSVGGRAPPPGFVGENAPIPPPGADREASLMVRKLDEILSNQKGDKLDYRLLSSEFIGFRNATGTTLEEHRQRHENGEERIRSISEKFDRLKTEFDKVLLEFEEAKAQRRREDAQRPTA